MSDKPRIAHPVYDKSPFAPQWEYHAPTWTTFLIIREWAQEMSNKTGYPLYLVGSMLMKSHPRDIDISMVMPLADFEKRYGEIPRAVAEEMAKARLDGYLATGKFNADAAFCSMTLQNRLFFAHRIDFKIQPDIWFTSRDRLLLAEPNGKVRVRDWKLNEWQNVSEAGVEQ